MNKMIRCSIKYIKRLLGRDREYDLAKRYFGRYDKYSFKSDTDHYYEYRQQYEASITRLYHSVEKGLAYKDYRAGFGKDNIRLIVQLMNEYSVRYGTDSFTYKTCLNILHMYVSKNREYDCFDEEIENLINALPGEANDKGGIVELLPPDESLTSGDFKTLCENRHSCRCFSDTPLDKEKLYDAIRLSMHTPSACNRQGWKDYVVCDKDAVRKVLENQNGNSGFSHLIDKLIVVVGDLRCFNRDREVHQVFIDGGMYAMQLLDCLYYYGIASVPLSASLTSEQEKNVREILGMHDAEVLIMIIAVGNYPDGEYSVPCSPRHEVECIEV